MGAPDAYIYLATTASDTDIVVKLLDISGAAIWPALSILLARLADYRPATISVSFRGDRASAVWLPVVP